MTAVVLLSLPRSHSDASGKHGVKDMALSVFASNEWDWKQRDREMKWFPKDTKKVKEKLELESRYSLASYCPV